MSDDFDWDDTLGGEIHPDRWERARVEVDHVALMEAVLQQPIRGNVMRCPMGLHRDSTPSWNIYRRSNSSFCFGCPPPARDQAYDNVNFVAKFYEVSRVEALQWIEKHFDLSPIGDVAAGDEGADEEEYSLTIEDLKPTYLALCPSLIETVEDARHLLKKYFLAVQENDPLFLARVIGSERLKQIIERVG